jgi:hypothetical protein
MRSLVECPSRSRSFRVSPCHLQISPRASGRRSTRRRSRRLRCMIRDRLVSAPETHWDCLSLPPCDQIVECVNVWHKAEGDPRNGAPDNDSVPHVIPLFPRRLDRADAGGINVARVACNSVTVCCNSASSSRESTPSASIMALTIGSASISSRRGSRQCELMRAPS